MMRGGPIDAAAPGAGKKPFLSRKNIRWNKRFHCLFGARLEQRIALRATGKRPRHRVEIAGPHNLAQLLAVAVAFDKYKCRRLFLFQATVPGKNQAAFLPRRANQTVTAQMPAVNYVLAHEAEPLGQLAEHAVGGELQSLLVVIHGNLD